MFFRNYKKQSMEVRLSDTIDSDKDGNNLELIDVLSFECNIDEEVDLKLKSKNLYEYIDRVLSERERSIIKMRYGLTQAKPLTQREVATLLGISRSYVSRIEKKALLRLEKEFNRFGIHEF